MENTFLSTLNGMVLTVFVLIQPLLLLGFILSGLQTGNLNIFVAPTNLYTEQVKKV